MSTIPPFAAKSATRAASDGTQGIRRVVRVLKVLAVHRDVGLRFVEVADLCELERPTAHRMLKTLVEEGLLVRDPRSKRYRLGALTFELGLAAAHHFNLVDLCAPSLQRLARATGDTSFLFIRRGNDAICVSSVPGHYPIQTPVVPVGSRQPLGVNAGGLALLLSMTPAEVDEIIAAVRPRLGAYGDFDADDLRQSVAAGRAQRYALIGEKAVPGVTAIGLPIVNQLGVPVAALTVAAISSRMTPARQQDIVPLLQQEVDEVRRLLYR
ncbi:IclR family transcriptional regulator [Pigmentiphaga litoralis]|uniref:IclR family transcriptional regulator n=1 Tax=Pigmentiphaga litoralis TaxID=516702 RepID=UPI003B42C043